MNILGIHDGHNATACLVSDGVLQFAIQEERLRGEKNYSGFPRMAVDEMLAHSGLRPDDIDVVAMASHHLPRSMNREQLIRHFHEFNSVKGQAKRLLRGTPVNRAYRAARRRSRVRPVLDLGVRLERVLFVEHHLAHASAAYFGSPWRDDVLVVTCDGSGDGLSATVNIGKRGVLERLAAIDESNSLGLVYAIVTFLLGMTPNEHEYKLMGMAPYAPTAGAQESYEVFASLFEFADQRGMRWTRHRGVPNTYYLLNYLRRRLAFHRFDHICAGLQRWTEETLARWLANCVKSTGIRRVALGGGVFMNVKANKTLAELSGVDDLFCFPSAGDESTALGAAWFAQATSGADGVASIPPIGPIYWGHGYAAAAVEPVLRERGVQYRRCNDIEAEVARLLATGEVVARFKGRMEFGARALGNRSILADPSNPRVVRTINEMIKSRDFWMPFACSILDRCASDYIVNPKAIRGPYMMMTYDTTSRVEEIRAGTHPYDDTVRPQIVDREWNPDYHRLIEEFARRRGIGAVLNTSLNLHGRPLVGTPEQALDLLERSGLRWLAIEDLLVTKNA